MGGGELDVDGDGTCALGGRQRGCLRGFERVTLVERAARVELPVRPRGLPRGLPVDLVPNSALGC